MLFRAPLRTKQWEAFNAAALAAREADDQW
jgi:hypothetical protein